MSTKETAEDVRRAVALALGWANTPPTDVLVRDVNANRLAMKKLQRHLAVLHLHKAGKSVDFDELKEAERSSELLARALFP